MSKRRRHGERGQVLPLFAVALLALVGMAALAIDVGYWRYQQRLQQVAADSAALAGGIEMNYSTANSAITSAAQKDAATNGFTDDGGSTTSVTVNHPPSSGAYAGNAAAVEVIVTKKQPNFFTGAFLTGGTTPVSTRAVAAENVVGRGCIYTLSGSITVNGGSGGVNAANCSIVANGGLTVNGNGTIDASSIGYASGSAPKGGSYPEATPAPSLPAADPCDTISGCAYLAANTPTGSLAAPPTTSKGVTTYYPGEYTSQLSPAKNSVFSAGLYILDNGLSASGNTTVTGTGVTIYNKSGAISIGGNTSFDLVAPTSGNYTGVVFYQPAANTNTLTLHGDASANGFEGALYFPGAALDLNGALPDVTLLVAASITVNGQGITVTSTGVPGGVGHFVLAE